MAEPTQHLRDRAAALAGELIQLKNDAALAGDDELNVQLKQIRRLIKSYRGPFTEEAYERLRAGLIEELYSSADSEERGLQARKESLRAEVRRTVEAELAAERAYIDADALALEGREAAVAERERQARPSYRARFAAAGAGLVVAADVLLRVA